MNLCTKNKVSCYFDKLYNSICNSTIHELIGKEALGDGYVGQLGYAGKDDLCQMIKLARILPGQRVLDLCCGMGGTSLWFAKQTGAKVTGIDRSSAGVKHGKFNSKGVDKILGFVLGDIKKLPFSSCSFNSIVCLDGFGASYIELFQQCFNILTPGGNLTFLLNLTPQNRSEFEMTLRSTGFVYIKLFPVDPDITSLMKTWLSSYHKHRRSHIRQVGRRSHLALTGEMTEFLKYFKRRRLERYFISAVKDG